MPYIEQAGFAFFCIFRKSVPYIGVPYIGIQLYNVKLEGKFGAVVMDPTSINVDMAVASIQPTSSGLNGGVRVTVDGFGFDNDVVVSVRDADGRGWSAHAHRSDHGLSVHPPSPQRQHEFNRHRHASGIVYAAEIRSLHACSGKRRPSYSRQLGSQLDGCACGRCGHSAMLASIGSRRSIGAIGPSAGKRRRLQDHHKQREGPP